MSLVHIPSELKGLLADKDVEVPTYELAEEVGVLLEDNEMPFFPAYTDHGALHVNGVLNTAVRLIPQQVWNENLLTHKDAAVITCAALLHDLAMHIREAGFVSLVEPGTAFAPCPWFSESRVARSADLDWPRLWADFQHEARHFGPGQLTQIFGEGGKVPGVAFEESLDPAGWTLRDRLLIGEFLRRHHGRLAHEIALYGFPGGEPTIFPVLADRMSDLANACGAVARSHTEHLRTMADYLDYLAPGSKRPSGALLLYHMALLRIADYMQLDAERAPILLLRLKQPQSPVSVEEWEKEGAVSSLDWDHQDPFAIYVTVNNQHGLRTHLALADLFKSIQGELDTTSAVLAEVYGSGDLAGLSLVKRRVLTNLEEESLTRSLPYLPQRAALRSDPDLFRLVVKDLYGNQPAVAGRELIQNAIDAVRARRGVELKQGPLESTLFRELPADVLVTLKEEGEGRWTLRLADSGIGMTPEVVVDYFLQAGASFGATAEELDELADQDLIDTMKTGRFGVGAFAAFLLGPEIKVVTRHIEAEKGLRFSASLTGDLVELEWDDQPEAGTIVEIVFEESVLPARRWYDTRETPWQLLMEIARFYRLETPRIAFAYEADDGQKQIDPPADVPSPGGRLPDAWRKIPSLAGYEAVLWCLPGTGSDSERVLGESEVVHNGIVLKELTENVVINDGTYRWSSPSLRDLVARPGIAVFDARHHLPVALHRYGLVDRKLPFELNLLDSVGKDLVAHALAVGAESHPLQQRQEVFGTYSRQKWLPTLPSVLAQCLKGKQLLVLWEIGGRIRELDFDFPLLRDLVASDNPISWREFPFRTAFRLDDIDISAYDYEERLEWGHSLDLIAGSADEWARRLGGQALATVVVRGDPATENGLDLEAGQGWLFPDWRRVDNGGGGDGGGIFIEGDKPNDPKIERRLMNAACGLRKSGGYKSVAVSALGNFQSTDAAESKLAQAWIRYVGSGIDRGPRRRAAAVEQLLEKHSSLRPAVNKWRRLSDGGDR